MRSFWKKILTILFPARCVACGRDNCFICPKCLAKIPGPEKPTKDWIISVWSYKSPEIKRLLWLIKFSGQFAAAEDLAETLYDHLSDELHEQALFENLQSPILVPIPLSKKSLRKRGYNQSEIFANAIALKSGGAMKVCVDALVKIKDTPTQHSIKNKSRRLMNLRGAYVVKAPEKIAGRNIILIDDITTTHATLSEAKKVLREAGAKKVLGFTVAH